MRPASTPRAEGGPTGCKCCKPGVSDIPALLDRRAESSPRSVDRAESSAMERSTMAPWPASTAAVLGPAPQAVAPTSLSDAAQPLQLGSEVLVLGRELGHRHLVLVRGLLDQRRVVERQLLRARRVLELQHLAVDHVHARLPLLAVQRPLPEGRGARGPRQHVALQPRRAQLVRRERRQRVLGRAPGRLGRARGRHGLQLRAGPRRAAVAERGGRGRRRSLLAGGAVEREPRGDRLRMKGRAGARHDRHRKGGHGLRRWRQRQPRQGRGARRERLPRRQRQRQRRCELAPRQPARVVDALLQPPDVRKRGAVDLGVRAAVAELHVRDEPDHAGPAGQSDAPVAGALLPVDRRPVVRVVLALDRVLVGQREVGHVHHVVDLDPHRRRQAPPGVREGARLQLERVAQGPVGGVPPSELPPLAHDSHGLAGARLGSRELEDHAHVGLHGREGPGAARLSGGGRGERRAALGDPRS
mmetsp:Transcript_39225/g.101483  ORF Transcript_39225/g.101483 Transcript_39225/m.101483 type:complete len:472 (+) Transcript_39225:140-1555(+)